MTSFDSGRPGMGEGLRADLSAVEIDTSCASALARVALQVLVEMSAANRPLIAAAIDHEIAGRQIEHSGVDDPVISLLTDVKMRLGRGVGENAVYLDEL